MSDKKQQDKSGDYDKGIGKDDGGGWDDFSEHRDRGHGISNTAPPPPPQKPSSDTSRDED